MEQRFIELESRLAFQEHAIEELSEVIVVQRRELDGIRRELDEVRQRLREAVGSSNVAPQSEEAPPPHY